MRTRLSKGMWLIVALMILPTLAVQAAPGIGSPSPVDPFLDYAFPSESPGSNPNASYVVQDYFAGVTFVEPIRIVEHPNADELVIVSKDGTFWRIDNDPAASSKVLFLDLNDRIQGKSGAGEGGVGGLVFHPEFGIPSSPNRGYVYVWYRWAPVPGFSSNPTVDGYQRLSRFTLEDGANSIDPDSEFVLIQQFDREQWHIGGSMFFANGFLHLSLGDEGNCCDRLETTQRIDGGLFSGILRIDVDQDPVTSHPIRRQPQNIGTLPSGWPNSFSQGYYIPNDNPFLDQSGGVLEEFFAIGLRHPWVISHDPITGQIWAADVGQVKFEEINVIEKGGNYEWAYKEGNVAGLIPEPAVIIGDPQGPLWAYDRSVGQAVIGAGVYRGNKHPEFFGKYLASDFLTGKLWTLSGTDPATVDVEEIAQLPAGFPTGINSYLLDRHGRILMANTAGALNPNGKIVELVANSAPSPEPPQFLSSTGIFDNLNGIDNLEDLDVHDGCVPYNLNEPFWSDRALKFRWICLPNDGVHDTPEEQIVFSDTDVWDYPVGTVFIKHFELLLDEADPLSSIRLETRALVHANNGWYGVTYRWDEDGSDGELLTTSLDEPFTILDTNGQQYEQIWHYPSRSECLQCHYAAVGSALGPNTWQVNGDFDYPSGIISNQLETLSHLGMFDVSLSPAQISNFLKSTSHKDLSAPIEDRARSYLDSNCGYCHRPDGVRANFDARFSTPLEEQNLLFGALVESLGIPGEGVIVPGSLEKSIAFLRADSTGDQAMPPLSKNIVDVSGVNVIAEWIDSVGLVGNSTFSDGSFIDGHHPSLFINEDDTLTNNTGSTSAAIINEFRFYARRLGNPLTPIVVRVLGDNHFEVVAIGTTRTNSSYQVGENRVAFSDGGEVVVALAPGETLATGFMDSNPDGSGWGVGEGSAIPADTGTTQDEIWALLPSPLIPTSSGFVAGADTPAVVVGQDPLLTNAGKQLNEFTGLKRSYRFGIVMVLSATEPLPGGNNPPAITPMSDQSSQEGDAISLQVQASDLDGDVLFYAAQGLPPGLQIGSADGLITGAIAAGAAANSPYAVTVTVDDGNGGSDSDAFNWAVSAPPVGDNLLVNGSFEMPVVTANGGRFQYFSGVQVPGWQITADIDLVTQLVWTAGEGNQSADLNGNQPGAVEQLVQGLVPGGPYELSFQYAAHLFVASASVEVWVNGQLVDTLSTGQKAPNYQLAVYQVQADANGEIVVRLVGASTGNKGMVLDDVQLLSLSGGSNNPPAITPVSDQSSFEGDAISLQVQASDLDGDVLFYAAQGLPPGLQIGSADGLITGAIAAGAAANSPYAVTVTVDDGNGGSDSDAFSWVVEVPVGSNNPPAITPMSDQSSQEGDAISLQVQASDLDGDVLFYAAQGLPPGLQIGSADGLITGAIAAGAAANSPYAVTVTVDDGNGGSDSDAFNWAVSAPPVGDNLLVNGSFEMPVVTANGGRFQYFSGVQVPGWQITADIDLVTQLVWTAGEGNQSADLNGNQPGAVEQLVQGLVPGGPYELSFQYAAHLFVASASVEVWVNGQLVDTLSTGQKAPNYQLAVYQVQADANGEIVVRLVGASTGNKGMVLDDVQLLSLSGGSNNPPAITPVSDQSSFEGDAISLQVQASDLDGDVLFYAAQGLPPGLQIGSADGLITGAIAAGAAANSPYAVTVTVDDGNGGSDSDAFSWVVEVPVGSNNPPAITPMSDQSSFEGDAISLQVQASDLDGDVLFYAAQGLPPGLQIGSADGLITGAIAAGAAANSPYAVTVTVDDGNGGSDSDAFSWVVEVPVGSNNPPAITPMSDQSSQEGDAISLQVQASDLDGDVLFYAAQGLPPGLQIGSADGLITGAIAAGAAANSPYAVTVTVDDGNGGSDSDAFNWAVSAPPVGDNLLVNGSFEMPVVTANGGRFQYFSGVQVPGWQITADIDLVTQLVWTAGEGNQSADLNGNQPGAVEQLVQGLVPGGPYELSFQYAAHLFVASASVEVWVNGQLVDTLSTGQKAPNYQLAVYQVQADANGEIVVRLVGASTGNKGMVLDDVQLLSLSGGSNNPPAITPVSDQSSFEGDAISLQVQASDLDGDVLFYAAQGLPPGLQIGSADGLITGAIAAGAAANSPYAVTVTVDDGNGGSDSDAFSWVVEVPVGSNNPPAITPMSDQSSFEGDAISLQVQASDLDGDVLFYAAQGLPPGLQIGSADGLITGAIAAGAAANSPYAVTVTVDDGNGGSDSDAFSWVVEVPVGSNNPPAITPMSDQSSQEGDAISLQVQASDLDGDVLFYAAQGLPPGLQIGSADGLITGAIAAGAAANSPYAVTVTVDDGNGGSDSDAFSWVVSITGSPTLDNGGFEDDGLVAPTTILSDWTVTTGNVETVASADTGSYALDLNGDQPGSISQSVSGLAAGTPHLLRLSWADQASRTATIAEPLATAEIWIDGQLIGAMRTTSDAPSFINCNVFPFVPNGSVVQLSIESTTSGAHGLLIDSVDVVQGVPPVPPESSFVANAGFEEPVSVPGPNPHLCGYELPGWLVTRENVDIISASTFFPPEGNGVLDLGGDGPGGIAQTISGLNPGTTYELSFQHVRHLYWNQVDSMTAEVLIDGVVVAELERDKTQRPPNWELVSIGFTAPASGKVTLEFRSTTTEVGGGILIDDIQLN